MTPGHGTIDVRDDGERKPCNQQLDPVQAVYIERMPEPQELVAGAVRLRFWKLVGVANDRGVAPVGLLDEVRKPLRRTGHFICVLHHELVMRLMKVHIAEIGNCRTARVLSRQEIWRVLVDRLREYENVGLGVVDLGPKLLRWNLRPIAIGRHVGTARVTERDGHDG